MAFLALRTEVGIKLQLTDNNFVNADAVHTYNVCQNYISIINSAALTKMLCLSIQGHFQGEVNKVLRNVMFTFRIILHLVQDLEYEISPTDWIFNPDRKHPYMGLFQIYAGWEKEMEIRGHHFATILILVATLCRL